MVSKTTLTVAEGASGSYTVKLDAQPTSDVVISGEQDRQFSDVTVSPATLTFTPSNWRHGADGDGGCRPGRRRGERHGVHHPRGGGRQQRRRVRPRDHRRGGRDRHRRRYRRGDGVQIDADGERGRQRLLYGGAEHAAHLQRGDQRSRQRQYGRDGVFGHPDLLLVQLGHGADGKGVRRPGRRRGERHSRHRPRGRGRAERQRVRQREHRRGGRDRHRRRYRRGDGIRVDADGDRGRQRNLHREAEHAARLQRGDQRNRQRQYGRNGVSGHPDLHHVQLEHGADRDGAGRPGRRRGGRHGRHRPRRRRRPERQRVRQREHRRGGRDRHRRRYRRGDGVQNHADGERGRQRQPTP